MLPFRAVVGQPDVATCHSISLPRDHRDVPYLCYGTYTMAWNAIGYELSDDYHERSRIQAVSGLFLAVMVLLTAGCTGWRCDRRSAEWFGACAGSA